MTRKHRQSNPLHNRWNISGIVGLTGIKNAVCIGRSLQKRIHRYAVAYVRTGRNRLAIGQVVGIALSEGIISPPTADCLLAYPSSIVQIVRPGDNVILICRCCPHLHLLGRQNRHIAKQHYKAQYKAKNSLLHTSYV